MVEPHPRLAHVECRSCLQPTFNVVTVLMLDDGLPGVRAPADPARSLPYLPVVALADQLIPTATEGRAPCYTEPTMARALGRKRKLSDENVARVPASRGVYVLYGAQGSPAYVGRGQSLRARLTDQLTTGRIPAVTFAYAETSTDAEASKLEHELVGRLLPRFNVHSTA